jgi:hypothetical protein
MNTLIRVVKSLIMETQYCGAVEEGSSSVGGGTPFLRPNLILFSNTNRRPSRRPSHALLSLYVTWLASLSSWVVFSSAWKSRHLGSNIPLQRPHSLNYPFYLSFFFTWMDHSIVIYDWPDVSPDVCEPTLTKYSLTEYQHPSKSTIEG